MKPGEDLLLFDAPGSPCARRVKITLIEKGLPFQKRDLDLGKLEQRSPAYLAINPNGLVPTLVHDGFALWESNVITEYLDDVFPETPLYPAEPAARSEAKKWQAVELALARTHRPLMYARVLGPMLRLAASRDEVLERARGHTTDPAYLAWEEKIWRLEVLTDAQAADHEAELREYLERVERALEGRAFLVGERFTTADVSMYPRLQMYPYVGIPLDPRRYPNVCRWSRRLAGRRSFAETRAAMDGRLDKLAALGLLARINRAARRPAGERTFADSALARLLGPVIRRAMGFGKAPATRNEGEPIPAVSGAPGRSHAAWKGTPPSSGALVLHGDPLDVESLACLAAMRHVGLDFAFEQVDSSLMAHRAGDQRRRNPAGELPLLTCGGQDVVGLLAIVERIAVEAGDGTLLGDTAEARARVRMWCAFDAALHKEFRPLHSKHVVRPRLRRRFGSDQAFLAALPADLAEADAHWIRSVWDDTIRIDMDLEGAVTVLRHKLARLDEELSAREYIAGTRQPSVTDLLLAMRVDALAGMPIGLDLRQLASLTAWRLRVGGVFESLSLPTSTTQSPSPAAGAAKAIAP